MSGRPPTRPGTAAVLLAVLVLAGCTGSDDTARPDASEPAPTASVDSSVLDIGLPRAVHRATPLVDGRVLLTGGCSAAGCEGVDEAAASVLVAADGSVEAGPTLAQPRVSHTASLLPDGRVLLIGGYPGEGLPPVATMELYDPSTGDLEPFGSLREARADHTSTVLPDGRVLVAGGIGADGSTLTGAELVDVPARTVAATESLPSPRSGQTALLRGGCVLVVGGTGPDGAALASTAAWCPSGEAWSPGPRLLRPRTKQAAAALPGGGVWVAGGAPDTESRQRFRDTELLLPGADRFVPGPDLPSGRYKITDAITTLPDGRVLLAGGRRPVVFDPATRELAPIGGPAADLGATRSFQTATAVDGAVLVTGGYDAAIAPTDQAWLFPVPRSRLPSDLSP